MRIAMVTDYYLPTLGGVQTAIKAQREALEQAGHEVRVFCPLAAPSEDAGVIALPTARGFAPDGYPFAWTLPAAAAILEEHLRRHPVDVVHVHTEMFAALAAFRTAAHLGLPLVQTMHGRVDVYTRSVLPLPAVTTALLARLHRSGLGGHEARIDGSARYTRTRGDRRMWRLMVSQASRADHVIVPSAHFAAKLVDQGLRRPLTVLSNGLEDSVLTAVGEPLVRARRTEEPLRVLWCGRLSPEKRPEVFLDALRELPGVEAEVFGDGVARRRVRRSAGMLPPGRVRVRGAVPQAEVLEAMRQSHVLVSTSWDFDNQPMVILEAIASGLPVIVTDPDLAEALPEGGHLVTGSPDAAGVAAALRTLRDDPALLARMSAAAVRDRERVAQRTHGDALIEVYRQAVAARGGRLLDERPVPGESW